MTWSHLIVSFSEAEASPSPFWTEMIALLCKSARRLRDDLAVLVVLEILLVEAPRRVIGGAMHDLGAGAHWLHASLGTSDSGHVRGCGCYYVVNIFLRHAMKS